MLLLRAALFLALTAATAASQETIPVRPPRVNPLVALLPYISDPSFQQELSLRADQTKSLLALRQQRWDEEYTTAPNDLAARASDREEAIEAAIGKLLSADQSKRLTQLAVQKDWVDAAGLGLFTPRAPSEMRVDTTRVSQHVLRAYPALKAALKLSDEQLKLVANQRLWGTVYLTPEQSSAAKVFLGPLVNTAWRATYNAPTAGRTTPFSVSSREGGLLALCGASDVRTALRLTEAQEKDILALKLMPTWTSRERNSMSPAARETVEKNHEAENLKALGALLNPDQMKRLRQLEVLKLMTDPATAPFGGQALIAELKLTPAQVRAGGEAQVDYVAAIARSLSSGDGPALAAKGVAVAAVAREKAVMGILTLEQARDLRARLGEPFTGKFGELDTGDFQSDSRANHTREATFGQYAGELTALTLTSVQTELGLTQEQLRKLRAATTKVRAAFPIRTLSPGRTGATDVKASAQAFAARSKLIGDALADILMPEQVARFRQIMMQQRQHATPGTTNICESAVSYPGVAEAIGLNAEQRGRLIAREMPEEVLTDKQQESVAAMLGKPFTGSFARAGRSTALPRGAATDLASAPPRAASLSLLRWDDLGLSSEQVTQLVPALNRFDLASGGFLSGGAAAPTPPPSNKAAAGAELDRAVTGLLTPEQLTRLDQLTLQIAAAKNLGAALTRPEVAKQVELTGEQLARIATAERETQRLGALLTLNRVSTAKRLELLDMLRDQLDLRILAVLTLPQKEAWKNLTGPPVPAIRKQPHTGTSFPLGDRLNPLSP